jgi:phosphatidylglycerophosphate synthase
MIDGPWRQVFPRVTGPLVALYRRLGLTPNQLTGAGFACALIAASLTALQWNVAAIVAWWLGRLFDGTDGIYARETGQQSSFGGYLDILLDMASYSVMVVGFYLAYPQWALAWMVISVFYTLCITSALALGEFEQKHHLGTDDHRSLRLANGLAEGGETGLMYTVFLLWPGYLGTTIYLWLGILLVTVLARTMLARRLMTQSQMARG